MYALVAQTSIILFPLMSSILIGNFTYILLTYIGLRLKLI